MSQRRRSSQQQGPRPTVVVGGAAAAILLIVAAVIAQLSGIDLLSLINVATPTSQVAPQPTSPAGTRVAVVGTGDWYRVIFSAPTGSTDTSTYVGGPDVVLVADLNSAQRTIDVAAFEMNSPTITQALLDAHRRGVQVRIVTDDANGLDVEAYQEYLAADEDERENLADEMGSPPDETTLDELYDAGIPIEDDDRSDLMHNKFIIIDSTVVWTGSMNLTINGTYRNNNNFVRIRNQRMVQDYQTEFNEMFMAGQFGPRSPANTPFPQFTVDGTPIEVYFAPEDNVIPQIVAEIEAARSNIRFMAFSFTENNVGIAMLERGQAGVTVQGIFETRGSETEFSELGRLFCAGFDVRQDSNPFTFHHKVIIIDSDTVLIGSFNFSDSAAGSNDENLVIIHNADIAAFYIREFETRFAEATPPQAGRITCP